jgi:hypothetical protein
MHISDNACPSDLQRRRQLPCAVASRRPKQIQHFRGKQETIAVRVSGERTANGGGLLRELAVSGAGVVLKSDYDIA